MSDAPPPPNPEQQPPESARDAKARAKGEKAYAKAQRPWYKKKRFILPLGLLLLIIIIGVATSGGEDGTDVADPGSDGQEDPAPQDEDEEGEDEATTTGVGSPARDGRFEFTVSSFECGESTVGDGPFQEEAQGQFCLMEVTVENIGDESQFFSGDNQYVFNEEGTEYSASTAATFANNPEGDELFTEINPGNSVDGTVVFDIPEDAEVAYAELHDSPFSGGVRVELQ